MNVTEIFKEILPILSRFAPSIASAIGGPVGLAAGFVLPLLSHAFESHPSDFSELIKKITSDPHACDKLDKLEKEYCTLICQMQNKGAYPHAK
jgi:hypothetical protein